jgi:DNA polymerase-3 subunit gamma/tau
VIFIFATTEFHKIPATIVSRSQYFNLSKLNDEEMNSVLSNVVEKEKINISNDASKQLIELANGHARDLLSMLEQMYMVSNNNINTELIYSMFGIVAIDKKIKLINLIIENNLAECLNLAESFIQSGANIYLLTLDICDILIDKLVYIQTKNQKLLKKINLKEFDSINSSQYKYLLNLLNIFEKELGKVKTSNEAYFYFKKMIFESLAICDTQNNNSVNIIETKENIKEEKVLKNTKDSNLNKIITNLEHSFTLEGMFSTKEYKNNKSDIHESVNQESKNQEKPNIFNEIKQDSKNEKEKNVKRDLEKIFLQVAFNYSKENNAKMQSNLQKMIESNLAAFANIGDCERVFISSNNAVIIKFNNTIDAELFNEYSLRQKFMDAYKKMFNQESVFIGLDNKKIDEFKIKFQEFKKKNNPLPDVNLSEFLSNDIISKAFDEFLR